MLMPRSYSSIDKIRAELAWVNETPDPAQVKVHFHHVQK
jgi:hypothetical protein